MMRNIPHHLVSPIMGMWQGQAEQAASRVNSTLDLFLWLVYIVHPCNSLKTMHFRSLSPGGAETIKSQSRPRKSY
jgi:hypothetical protein